jgi:hypothetical protein
VEEEKESNQKNARWIKDINWKSKTIKNWSQALVAYAYNPDYLGDWDREYHGLRPALANSSWDLPFPK